jgi:hypothetical protein
MALALYMDVHVPAPIARQLRLRGVDLVTAQEDGTTTLPDHELLARAGELSRVLVTHDIRFKAMAEGWIRENKPFGGMIYGHAEGASIGQYVRDLELIAGACTSEELRSQVLYLPL